MQLNAGIPVSTRDGRTRDLPDLQGQYIAFPKTQQVKYQYSPLPGEAGTAFCAEISRSKIYDAGNPARGFLEAQLFRKECQGHKNKPDALLLGGIR